MSLSMSTLLNMVSQNSGMPFGSSSGVASSFFASSIAAFSFTSSCRQWTGHSSEFTVHKNLNFKFSWSLIGTKFFCFFLTRKSLSTMSDMAKNVITIKIQSILTKMSISNLETDCLNCRAVDIWQLKAYFPC